MRAATGAIRAALTVSAAVLLTGCGVGVHPTGVLDGGAAPGGLTTGMRLYFVSSAGRLEAVSRPSGEEPWKLGNPDTIIKLLLGGPSEAEREAGLTTLVEIGGFRGAAGKGRVTVQIPHADLFMSSVDDRNLMGQLVCSVARGQVVADGTGTKRTDDIRVEVWSMGGREGSYVCSDFLG
ncbi:hypothetical protein [Streptomyces clavuligerus]|uniref:Lipoprotein n=1 Tax=Streptomyces clavuligerus TaxID=1901 RepID=E2Q8A6_STRCL|nr:hypothetical protein [Streptomyces clavuligerus]ANW21415.1 hypothetical protein BB341_25990 [Streptomyces clavuligerus]AXU16047.1 hypothetical protein D1794_27005 [Streptomyces clavuligerus]EFG05438.1 Hypothetical protein SCLAV_0362 [Streptomyces clavuligerus]MBY6306182.1 hypothetical protein [Streptomyces clavuligerus]QCS08825.1 hypothetical protein CRV15_26370 [Streptomyces clavuligerus]